MEKQNSRRNILMPILFSLILVAGIGAGYLLSRVSGKTHEGNPVIDKLLSVIDYVEMEYVDTISKTDFVEAALPQILLELDPHSQYIPASEQQSMSEPLEGNFDGIGVQFNIQEDTVVVVNVISGGPSHKRGILAGDRIVKVNDTLIAGVKISNDKVMKKLKGPKGTKVMLGIGRKGEKTLLSFEITRGQIPLYSIESSYMIREDIGFVKINKFSKITTHEFKKAVTRLKRKGMKKIIIDLRGNGGGYMDAAVNLADEFLTDKQLIVYTYGKSRPKTNYFSTQKGFCIDLDVAILIDETSASASEIVAGAIQDNDRGTIIGRRSFGKGLVQEPVVFKDGSELRLTIARYYTPTGRCIQKPYTKGSADYYYELGERLMHGELEEADSIKFSDSLRYTTPKGRTVYGGGGIMPDIFIPLDTAGYTTYLRAVINKGLVYKFAFQYADNNRKKLSGFQDPEKLEFYLNGQNLSAEFNRFAALQGIKINPASDTNAKAALLLNTQLKAYIARNILDDKGFYPIWHKVDDAVLKAVDVLEKGKA